MMLVCAVASGFKVDGCWAEVDGVGCFAGETRVMTRAGSRPIADLAGADHELLTTGGEWREAPVKLFGRQRVWQVTVSRSGVTKTIRATAEHGWILRNRAGLQYEAKTECLLPGDRMQFAFPARPAEVTPDRTAVARGFVYGDGSTRGKNRSCAYFCGSKDASLLPFFDGLGCVPRTYDSVVVINGLPGDWKRVRPPLDSAADVLYGWLTGYFAADGDVDATGRPTLSSADRDSLEYVRLACQAVGVGTFGIRSRLRKGYGDKPTALHLVGLMRGDLCPKFFAIPAHRQRFLSGRGAAERRGWNVLSASATADRTKVYSAVVKGTHAFALEDNLLSRI